MADERSSSKRSGGSGSSAKKAAAKKSTSKKSTSKKSPAKKSPAKRSTAKKADSGTSTRGRAPRAEPARRASGTRVAEEAARQLAELTTKDVEAVTALHRTDDGWQVEVEVLELRRVPTTTDVLATYEVTVSSSGELEGYRRVGRYVRGQTEAGS